MSDPKIMELAGKVSIVSDDELNKIYPDKTASRIEITLRNGKKLERLVDIPKGDPRDPMEEKDIVAKIKRFAGSRDGKKLDRIADIIMNIEKAENVGELVSLI
jgi:2-methylcitrate dehydratase PrpD